MKASIMSYCFASVTDSLSLSHSKIETDPQQGCVQIVPIGIVYVESSSLLLDSI